MFFHLWTSFELSTARLRVCVFLTLRSESLPEVTDPRSDNVDSNPSLKDDGAVAEEEEHLLSASILG